MRAKASTRREFLRRVYRHASIAGLDRSAVLDEIADKALAELNGGKALTSASGGGVSSSYLAFFDIWDAQDRLELVDWARGYIEDDDVEVSLGLLTGAVRYVGADFSGLVH